MTGGTIASRASLAAGLLCTLCALPAAPAEAAEDEAILGAQLSYGARGLGGDPQHGGTLGLEGALGLSESLWLGGQLELSLDSKARERPQSLGAAYLGINYALDALQFVPSAELSVGLAGNEDAIRPSLRAALAVDRFISRTLTLGLGVAYRWLPEPLGGQRLSVGLRLGWRLDL